MFINQKRREARLARRNKIKSSRLMYESSDEDKPKIKRGRGRPPGSKSNRKYKRIIEESNSSDQSFDPSA